MKYSTIQMNVATHLSGGLRANLANPIVPKVFPIGSRQALDLPLGPGENVVSRFQMLGLTVIGTVQEFVSGHVPSRVWYPAAYGAALYRPHDLGPVELWSALANSAREQGDMESHGVMAHVSFALRAAGLRLLDVSDSYFLQLRAAVEDGVSEDTRFSNLEVFNLFLNCHSVLAEACSARDYLAQFLAKHVYSGIAADSMARLMQRRSKLAAHPITAMLDKANDKGDPASWMVRMSEYRNIVTHRAPLPHMQERDTKIEIKFMPLERNIRLPRIVVQIPGNPFAPKNGAMVDALNLLHAYHAELLHLAAECAKYSPYPPTFQVFDKSNIISFTPHGAATA